MFRFTELYVKKWFDLPKRKPVILRGARQVGKTELVRQFCRKNKIKLAEINCEKYLYLDHLFKTFDIERIIRELQAICGFSFRSKNTLVFLDEIQSTPHGLPLLRYFYEEKPDLAVISAGSLLEFVLKKHNFSMPVGRIEYCFLGPFTFKEFLWSVYPKLYDTVNDYQLNDEIPEILHKKLIEAKREYMFVGGMPEAVLTYKQTGLLQDVSRIHASIINTYYDDFTKYAKHHELLLLQNIFMKIPSQIGQKVKYVHFSKENKTYEIKKCLDLLHNAKLFNKVIHSNCGGIPLNADQNDSVYKLIHLDIGLMNYQNGMNWLTFSNYDEFKLVNEGAIAEQFIGQHLLQRFEEYVNPSLNYWLRESKKTNAEIDYVISVVDQVIPIEIKAGQKGSLKSLFHYFLRKNSPLAVRFDLNKPSLSIAKHVIHMDGKKHNVSVPLLSLPLYLVEEVVRLVQTYLYKGIKDRHF